MHTPLHVLIVEDREEDAVLVSAALRAAGFFHDWVRVDTEQAFREQLAAGPDLILADYQLPQFSGMSALQIAKAQSRDIPFIIVSGSIGEDLAVAALQLGADDYLLKDRLTRLGQAVEHALAEKQLRADKRHIEQELRERENRFRALIEHGSDVINLLDAAGRILYASPAVTRILGYALEDYVGRNGFELMHPDDVEYEHQAFLRVQQTPHATIDLTLRIRHHDGSWRNLEGSVTNLLDEPSVKAIVVNFRDVTDRQQAEIALRESEKHFSSAFEYAAIGMALVAPDGRWLKVNHALCKIVGYSEEELLAKTFQDITHPDDLEADLNYVHQMLAGEMQTYQMEKRYLHKSGRIIWVLLSVSLVRDGAGQPLHFISQIQDVAERKQAEAALQASEARFRSLFATSPDAILLLDPHDANVSWPIVDCNEVACQMNGYLREELIGQSVDSLNIETSSPEEHARYLERLRQEGVVRVEALHRHKDGHVFPIEVSTSLFIFEGRELVLGIDRDISERKQAEAALHESERREREQAAELQTIMDTAPAAVWIAHDQMAQVITGNRASYEMLRLPLGSNVSATAPSEHRSLPFKVYQDGRELPPTDLPLQVAAASGVELRDFEEDIVFADGAVVHTLGNVMPLFDEAGRPRGAVGVFIDITQRQHAEEALRVSEARFRALIENGSDLISILNGEGHFIYESPSSARILGFRPQELIGHNVLEFTHPDDLPHVIEALGQIRQVPGQVIVTESRFRHKDGSWRCLEAISHNLLDDPAVNGLIVNSRDVTERYAAEKALQQAELSYRQLFEEMPIGLYRTTPQGEIIDANQTLLRLLGHPNRETLLATSVNSFYVNVKDRNREQEQLIRDQVVHNFEMQLRRYDGTIIWVEDTARRVGDPDGLYQYYEGSLQDVTDRKERERELEAIASVSAALRTARTLAEMWSIILDQIYALLTVDGASIAMRDPATGESVFEAGRGTGTGYIGRRVPAGAGVIGHVIASGRVYLTNDARHDPTFFWPHLLGDLQAVACIPLIVQEQTIGAVWVGRQNAISALELSLLEAIGDIAGSAIHRVALYEAERKQRVLAESLRDTSAALSSTLNYDEVLDLILWRAQHVVPHDHARVVLIDSGRGYIVRSRGYAASTPGDSFDLANRPHLKQIQATGRPLIIPDTRDFPNWSEPPELNWVRSYVGIPIRLKGEVAGFLILASAAPNFFGAADSERIQAFANQCAIAIENARLYQEVSRYAEELEMRVADRTRELTEANQRLQELDRLKSKFVSDVSHELRTPVTSLSLHAELLESGKPEKRDYYIKILQEQARRLSQLVEDILNLSRLELGAERAQFQPVDLNALVASIVPTHQPSAEVAGLDLTCTLAPDLPLIQSEPNQLAQVITNLVANAINYTRHGQVQVRTYQRDQYAYLEVQDTGLGIDPEDIPHLFDRFYRGQQATRSKIRGTGLGLAIVKEIVDLHGGTITVDSAVGRGSTFRVSLPCHSAAADPAQ